MEGIFGSERSIELEVDIEEFQCQFANSPAKKASTSTNSPSLKMETALTSAPTLTPSIALRLSPARRRYLNRARWGI